MRVLLPHSLYLSVLEVSTVEADDLSVSDFETAEALVRSAFGTTFRAHDWLHAVDGVHELLTEGDATLAHAASRTAQTLPSGLRRKLWPNGS